MNTSKELNMTPELDTEPFGFLHTILNEHFDLPNLEVFSRTKSLPTNSVGYIPLYRTAQPVPIQKVDTSRRLALLRDISASINAYRLDMDDTIISKTDGKKADATYVIPVMPLGSTKDNKGRELSFRHTDGWGWSATFDKNGNGLSFRHTNGTGHDWAYDDNGNMLMACRNRNGTGFDATYDDKGNELSVRRTDGSGWDNTYDDNGKMLTHTLLSQPLDKTTK